MKTTLFTLLAGIAASVSAHARDLRPSRFQQDEATFHPAEVPVVGRVVLVHGILETGNNYRMLRQRLQKRGFDCLVPRLRPCDGRGGLEALADGLKRDIDEAFGNNLPIQVIGFSMGGIVSRHYLQELGGAKRCRSFFTISSPHNGSHMAWLYPSKGAVQMRPGSDFLTDLARSEERLGKMPVFSYWTPYDLMILPAKSSVWKRAENLSFPVALHPLMLTTPSVLDDIERRLIKHAD
jgi:triacylglycerol lipase